MSSQLRAVAILLIGGFFTFGGVATAQNRPAGEGQPDTDSLGRRPDPVIRIPNTTPEDTSNVRGPGFQSGPLRGRDLEIVARKIPYAELLFALGQQPGSIVLDLSTPGWAHGLTVNGADPNTVGLSYADLPLDDLFFGRPRFEFAPITTIDKILLDPVSNGRPYAYNVSTRAFDEGKPLTEALYWTSNQGLQTVTVTHSQRRQQRLGKRNGTLGLLASYHGKAATGEFPSSKLERGRQMMARVRYEQDGWSLELNELYNRGSVGQHDGVNPPIFRRLQSSVMNPGQERQARRNDLSARLLVRALGRSPLSTHVFYTRQTDVYLSGSFDADTLSTKTRRFGVSIEQPLTFGRTTAMLFGRSWSDAIRTATWLTDSLALATTFVATGVRLHHAGALTFDSELSYQSSGTSSGISVVASIEKRFGALAIHGSGGVAPVRQTLFARNGYGRYVDQSTVSQFFGSDTSPPAVGNAQVGISGRVGGVALDARAFATFGGTGDVALAAVSEHDTLSWFGMEAATTVGFTGTLSFRMPAQRGIYAGITPTLQPRASTTDAGRARIANAVPELFVRATLGARYKLFQGDLDANAYVRATYWSDFTGRTFNVPTALFVLPGDAGTAIPASTTVDFVLEAGVRTATIFLAYENAFAGTNLLQGNLIVPGYPLAEQRFRLGVFWPILN